MPNETPHFILQVCLSYIFFLLIGPVHAPHVKTLSNAVQKQWKKEIILLKIVGIIFKSLVFFCLIFFLQNMLLNRNFCLRKCIFLGDFSDARTCVELEFVNEIWKNLQGMNFPNLFFLHLFHLIKKLATLNIFLLYFF